MVDRNYVLQLMKSKNTSIDDFKYDKLSCPPISAMFTPEDIWRLKSIATSIKYSAKTKLKYDEIDKIMRSRGFVKLASGTNRICYRCVENDSFVVKVAYDSIGMKDNPQEYINQFLLKPFCTKIFEVAGDGVIATVERVKAITSREEYLSVASDVFTLLNDWILGEYVMDDIGCKCFMNVGIRPGFGIVLLDFPYLFKLDGNKLFCSKPDPSSSSGTCDGEIDYSPGFDYLYCKKCGARYQARELAKEIKDENIILKGKGDKKMKVSLRGGSHNVSKTITEEPVAKSMPSKEINTTGGSIKVSLKHTETETAVVEEKPVEKKTDIDPKQAIAPAKPEVEKVEVYKEPKSPITFTDDKKLSNYEELKQATANVVKFLKLILNDKKANNKAQAKKLVINCILDNIDAVKESFNDEELKRLVDALFFSDNNVLNVHLDFDEGADGESQYCVKGYIINSNDDFIDERAAANLEFNLADEDNENVEAEIEVAENESYGDINKRYNTPAFFSARTIDINEIFTDADSSKVLVVVDSDGEYITVDDNNLLVIGNVDDKDLNLVELVSTDYIEQCTTTIDQLTEQVNSYELDSEEESEEYDEEVDAEKLSVNGIPMTSDESNTVSV